MQTGMQKEKFKSWWKTTLIPEISRLLVYNVNVLAADRYLAIDPEEYGIDSVASFTFAGIVSLGVPSPFKIAVSGFFLPRVPVQSEKDGQVLAKERAIGALYFRC